MSARDQDDAATLGRLRLPDEAPAPGATLLAAVGAMRPVATRRPARTLAAVATASAALVALLVVLRPTRADLSRLDPAAWWAMGALWATAFAAALALALLPPRRAVLPDGRRALLAAVTAALGLAVACALWPPGTAPFTVVPSGSAAVGAGLHCFGFALLVATLPLSLGVVALRGALPTGAWRVGAALGAAGGALGGVALHALCPFGGALHVAAGHAGAVSVAAALGALVTTGIVRRG